MSAPLEAVKFTFRFRSDRDESVTGKLAATPSATFGASPMVTVGAASLSVIPTSMPAAAVVTLATECPVELIEKYWVSTSSTLSSLMATVVVALS
ncbi:hypothetical protein [Actinoplanes sp. NPDC049802]|uniref:hypothetical protein n=1 Tax=Actinoplanes sp. NPDC049802 TaxID=3154742 RepID=UPI00340FF6CC